MHSSSLTSKGQITIPREIRDLLGLKPGDRVGFYVRDHHVIVFPKKNKIESAFGMLKAKRSANLKDIDAAIRKRGGNEGG